MFAGKPKTIRFREKLLTFLFILIILSPVAFLRAEKSAQAATVEDPSVRKQGISLLGHIGGAFNDVFVVGNYLYAATSAGLQVFDVSNVSSPTLLGEILLPESAKDVFVKGNYAYVADDTEGLQIIDISKPSTPAFVSSHDTPSTANSVFVSGNYAYVADGESGLQIVDISNPSCPNFSGRCDTPSTANSVFVSGNYAYVADGESGLQIIDVSNTSSPFIASSIKDNYQPKSYAYDVSVSGNYAYMANGEWFSAVDISIPTKPSLGPGIREWNKRNQNIFICGNYAYVSGKFGSVWSDTESLFRIFNLTYTNLFGALPEPMGEYRLSGDTKGAFISDGNAYVANGNNGFKILNVSNPSAPTLACSYNISGSIQGLYIQSDHAFVAGGASGFQVYDISNVSSPRVVWTYDTTAYVSDIYVSNDLAFLSVGESLQIFDISEPSSLKVVGNVPENVDTSGGVHGIHVLDSLAFVATPCGNLVNFIIFDVSNPSDPKFLSSIDTPGNSYSVFAQGNYAYVADGPSLQIIDFSNHFSPTIAGVFYCGWTYDVDVKGNHAYVADLVAPGLRVVDISNPSSPILVGSYSIPPEISKIGIYRKDIFVSGPYAYVAEGDLLVLDVSNPSQPTLTASYSTVTGGDTFVSGNRIFVGDWNSGFFIFELDKMAPTTSVSISPELPNGENGWYKINPTISFSTSETAFTYYRIDSGPTQTYSTPFTIPDGEHTIYYQSVDQAGNEEEIKSLSLKVDTQKPVIQYSGVTSGGIYNSNITPIINAIDVNPDTTDFKLDGSAFTSGTAISSEGSHTLGLNATDKAGNQADTLTISFKIDKTAPPAPTLTQPTSPTRNSSLILSGTAEANSTVKIYDGVNYLGSANANAQGAFSMNLSNLSEGTHSLSARASDQAGNKSASSSQKTVIIDLTSPSTPAISSSTHSNQNSWYSSNDPILTWSADDPVSGIGGYSYVLDQNSSTVPEVTSKSSSTSKSYADLSDGTWYFHLRVVDNAGNWGDQESFKLNIDSLAPKSTLSLNPSSANGDNGYYSNLPSITLSSSEAGMIYYQWDSIQVLGWKRYVSSIVAPEGAHTLYYFSQDALGNKEVIKSVSVMVDTFKPSTPHITSKTHPDQNSWYLNNNPILSWSADDEVSGMGGYLYLLDKLQTSSPKEILSASTTYRAFSNISNGIWYLHLKAKDKAGNWGTASHYRVKIDSFTPKGAISAKDFSRRKPGTKIKFRIIEFGKQKIKVKMIIKKKSSLVKTLIPSKTMLALRGKGKSYTKVWNGRDVKNKLVPAGIYTIELTLTDPAGNKNVIRKNLVVSR